MKNALAATRRVARKAIDGARYYGVRALSVFSPEPLRGHRLLQKNEVIWHDEDRFIAGLYGGEVFSD